MATRTFNISALSPMLQYTPQQDVPNSVWKSDQGGLINNNANTGSPGRVLSGTGTVTISGFGSGLGFAGSLQGVFCSYTATLSSGEGNQHDASTLPAVQTTPPITGMLASFTGLEIDNWILELRGECQSGSFITITKAVIDGWVGQQGETVTEQGLDNTSSDISYSGVDWSLQEGLRGTFYEDTQHYTSVYGATMSYTFEGSAVIVWSSVDAQHGAYSIEIDQGGFSSSSDKEVQYFGYNPFLAVPVPYYFASGLDPTKRYTLVLKNTSTNGSYVDLDYIQVWTSTGGGPPNGGLASAQPDDNGINMTAIIAGSVGGGVCLIVLATLLLWLWRRRRTKMNQRTQPFNESMRSSTEPAIPLHMHATVSPNPHDVRYQQVAEQQRLLQPSTITSHGSPASPYTPFSASSSGGYDPYAAFGGHLQSHPGSIHPSPILDPVQRRRIEKTAEIDAARERARVGNTSSATSAGTPYPPSTTAQSWDISSQTATTSIPTSSNQPTMIPDEPPPSYEPP